MSDDPFADFDRLDAEWLAMTGRAHFYSRDGEPLTTRQYLATERAIGTNDPEAWEAAKRVDQSDVVARHGRRRYAYRISTVWLGMDHQFGAGPPLIFETMIFTDDENLDTWCDRYATEAEAAAGHRRVVDAIQRQAWGELR